jgi:hypothetical protein
VKFTTVITGNLRAAMQEEIKRTAGALRAAVQATGADVQSRLRAQVQSAGLRGGQKIANAWRVKVFPASPSSRTFRPSVLIFSRMPDVVDSFERGARITAKGGKFLAIPTGFNRQGGRNGNKPRVTTAQMVAARKQAFVIRSKSNSRVSLWCLRTSEAQSRSRGGRVTRQVIAANTTRVGTGRGTIAGLTPTAGRAQLLKQGFVPMFVLLREVQQRKRLDVAGVRREAAGVLASNIATEFSKLPHTIGEGRA